MIIDGKKVASLLEAKLKNKIQKLPKKLVLVIVQIGEKADSTLYIKRKKDFGEKIGAEVKHLKFADNVSEEELIVVIQNLNKDVNINGIIVQLPLPKKLNQRHILDAIMPSKDVDGMTTVNQSLLLEGKAKFLPATTKGIISLFDFYKFLIVGKKVVVVGRSTLVGKPTALAFLNRNATVTITHSQTKNLAKITKEADILIVAIGIPNFIKKKHVRKGQIIIDVGINISEKGVRKLVGDVDFENVRVIAKAITPVPGGVGPMTVASLFENLLDAYEFQNAII